MHKVHTAMTARRDAVLNGERRDGGFTLIELLIVVLIIGVLAAIAIPVYLSTVNTAKDESAKATVSQAITAITAYQVQNGNWPATLGDTDFRGPNQSEIAVVYNNTDATGYCVQATPAEGTSFYANASMGSAATGTC